MEELRLIPSHREVVLPRMIRRFTHLILRICTHQTLRLKEFKGTMDAILQVSPRVEASHKEVDGTVNVDGTRML